MTKRAWSCLAVAIAFGGASCSSGGKMIKQDELVRRTQEIVDAVGRGDRQPFEKYFAPDRMIFDEEGRAMDKKAFVAEQSSLPQRYAGSIKQVNPQSSSMSDTALS